MDHGHSWNRQCTRSPQDWELESVQNFFELLYSNVPSGQGMDQICWRPSREGKFDVHSYYDVLRGLGGGGGMFSLEDYLVYRVPRKVAFFI
jgi:hypothetical protein